MVKRRVKKICYFEAYCQHVTTNLSSLVHVLYTIGEDFLNNGSIVKYTHPRFSFFNRQCVKTGRYLSSLTI